MPKKLAWTDAQDMQIRRLRTEGASWDSIAATLSLSRWSVIDRGRQIGARLPPADFEPPPEDPERESMPPGDPRSWDAINVGTMLEGNPYPLPRFRH